MADLSYYLGPWVLSEDGPPGWTAPAGTHGLLDFGSLPSCATSPDSEDHRPIGFFAIDPAESLSLDYLSLGRGDCRELKPSEQLRKEVGTVLGVTPEGDTLCDWLVSLFDNGDPTGQNRWKPLVPTRAGEYEIHLGGHSRIWTAKHAVGDKRWNRTRDILRADLVQHDRECKAEAKQLRDLEKSLRKAGKTKDADKAKDRAAAVEFHAENVLDAICRKYRCEPTEISTEIRRGRARTTLTESFDKADGALGPDQPWGIFAGGAGVTSNQCVLTDNGTFGAMIRCTSPLSASDCYAKLKSVNLNDGYSYNNQAAAVIRLSATGFTCYGGRIVRYFSPDRCYLSKWSGDSNPTSLGYDNSAWSANDIEETVGDGSTITAKRNGSSIYSATDSAYTELYCGMFLYGSPGDNVTVNNWEASDGIVDAKPRIIGGGFL